MFESMMRRSCCNTFSVTIAAVVVKEATTKKLCYDTLLGKFTHSQ